ncbi:MAG: hypothetical protein V4614_04920 [Pseudomonadota bacterium]
MKGLKNEAETGCKERALPLIMAIGEKGMRYYPAFGVKSGRDAGFRRFLNT